MLRPLRLNVQNFAATSSSMSLNVYVKFLPRFLYSTAAFLQVEKRAFSLFGRKAFISPREQISDEMFDNEDLQNLPNEMPRN